MTLPGAGAAWHGVGTGTDGEVGALADVTTAAAKAKELLPSWPASGMSVAGLAPLDLTGSTNNHYIQAPDQSGWPDSNRRPPAPKAGALTKLRYIPETDP